MVTFCQQETTNMNILLAKLLRQRFGKGSQPVLRNRESGVCRIHIHRASRASKNERASLSGRLIDRILLHRQNSLARKFKRSGDVSVDDTLHLLWRRIEEGFPSCNGGVEERDSESILGGREVGVDPFECGGDLGGVVCFDWESSCLYIE
jgi:hypothetical protein